jgi:hypothetical protein
MAGRMGSTKVFGGDEVRQMEILNKPIIQFPKAFQQRGINPCLLLYSRGILYYAWTKTPSILLIIPEKTILLVRRGTNSQRERRQSNQLSRGIVLKRLRII